MKTIPLANPFGAPVYYEHSLSSTMDTARDLAAGGAPQGTVICAGFQEAGRGRIGGRRWLGEAGDSLFFTVLLRYGSFAAIPGALPLRTGLAVSLAIEDFAPALAGRTLIKWPNDIMIRLPGAVRKAAGILCESDGSAVFIGVGVNLLQTEFPGELRDKAISIAQALLSHSASRPGEGGAEPDGGARFRLLERILLRLYRELHEKAGHVAADAGNAAGGAWRERLEERLYMKGERVRFAAGGADSGRLVEGLLLGIGEGGELRILPPGAAEEQVFVTGELDLYA